MLAGRDRRRSMQLAQFAPLADVPGVRFVSLQRGAPAEEARQAPARLAVADYTDELNVFADTAALVAAFDLGAGCCSPRRSQKC